MPQLDRLAYVSQVIWLIVIFIGLYLLILKTGLPKLYKVLRYRKERLKELNDGVIQGEKEVFFVGRSARGLILTGIGGIRPLVEQVGKILENNLEERKVTERSMRGRVREMINFREYTIVSDLVTCKLIDQNKYVKKGVIEKKIVSN